MPHSLFVFSSVYFHFVMFSRRRNQLLTPTTVSSPTVRAYGIAARRVYVRNQTEGAFEAPRKGQYDTQEKERIANALRYKETKDLLISLRKLGEIFNV